MTSKLRIGIDVHSLGGRQGGNETYYAELVRGLVALPNPHDLILYYTNAAARQRVAGSGHISLAQLRPRHPLLRIPLSLPWRSRADGLDIFHAQHVIPPFLRCKTVTTIPDIAYEHFPQAFPQFQRVWMKQLIRRSARKADHIITVSEYSKRDIVRTYRVPEEKITVTYEGAGEEFRPHDRQRAQEDLARKYGIEAPFILYLGRLQGRKNLARVVEAYARVRHAGLPHKLVLAGKRDSLFAPVLSRIRELNLESDVSLPGYVHGSDVPLFYSAAEVFVYSSLFEGFGLPVIEAMACGVPVITSQGSSLQEVAGEAALLVDPLSVDSITNALLQALQDDQLRFRLRQAGLERSKFFNFEKIAQQTLAVYECM